MKKVIKISLAAVAALLFFLNVSLSFDGNKVDSIDMTLNTQSALADGQCYMDMSDLYCYCDLVVGPYCVATCQNWVYRCKEIIIEGK